MRSIAELPGAGATGVGASGSKARSTDIGGAVLRPGRSTLSGEAGAAGTTGFGGDDGLGGDDGTVEGPRLILGLAGCAGSDAGSLNGEFGVTGAGGVVVRFGGVGLGLTAGGKGSAGVGLVT
ncbi:MAG: PE family protein, partial [Planctomycetia bacterium]